MASTRRILDLLAVSPKIRSGNLSAENITGEFHFSDVGFHYQSGPEIFKGIDLKLPAKKTTAFVGTTGSGKSTLIKLLLRFYEASDGVIRLDDKELSNYNISSLRQQVGLVSQDVFLFHGTVRENLAYGSFDASDKEIQAAARLAEAHEFIEKLADGYDTLIGERGQKLSGGQRQRLALARAILKDPKVLILDEATSAVDNETEAAIQRSLVKITAERTTIIVAHRLSTIVSADIIHVLDSGQIKESGTHTELLARKGIYHHLWSVQTGSQGETA